jgi:hypothetical protein
MFRLLDVSWAILGYAHEMAVPLPPAIVPECLKKYISHFNKKGSVLRIEMSASFRRGYNNTQQGGLKGFSLLHRQCQ